MSGTEPGAAVAGTSEPQTHRGELGLQSLRAHSVMSELQSLRSTEDEWDFRAWRSVAGTSEPQTHRDEWGRAWRRVTGTSAPGAAWLELQILSDPQG